MKYDERKINILLVDDNPQNLLALETILEAPDRNLVRASSGEEALRFLLSEEAAVILLDVNMPGIGGLETAAMIRGCELARGVPIVFLTAYGDADDSRVSQGYSLGAVDYIVKPINPEALKSKVAVFVELYRKTEQIKRQADLLREQNIEIENASLQRLSRLIDLGHQLAVVGVMAIFARHPLAEDTIEAIATVAAPIAQGIERKRAEEAIRASEEQFRILADAAPVMIWACGMNKLYTFFNKPWLDFTGRAMEEELGAGWTEGVHPEDYARCLETYVTSFEAREPFKMEYRLRRHDGKYRWLLDHGVPRFSPASDFLGYIGACVDITERKQAEEEREQLAREQVARATAEAANRSKDEFLAMVSHELRSPLNSILGYTRMLRSCSVNRDAINNASAVVERSAKAQLQIIEDLLDSARIVTGKLRIEPGPVDLAPALEAALDTVRSVAEAKGVTLAADFGSLPEQMLGDSTRLQQVVWNLLANAVKFTPEGGRVELQVDSDANHIRIKVSDTGRGIEPEFLPFVFDRFRQADQSSARRYGGLGLGLSLVKHLVELHGGTITAASEGLGRGATFTVTLSRRHPEFIAPPPTVAPREARTEGAVTLGEALSLEGVSVLVVDDREEARMILTQALSEYGAQVTAVSSGAEALALLSDPSSGKRPDALILDLAMPDEDGYTTLRKVRALEAEQGAEADRILAVALTATGRSKDRLRALRAGFHMHVAKPVEPAELAVVIASLVRRTDKTEARHILCGRPHTVEE